MPVNVHIMDFPWHSIEAKFGSRRMIEKVLMLWKRVLRIPQKIAKETNQSRVLTQHPNDEAQIFVFWTHHVKTQLSREVYSAEKGGRKQKKKKMISTKFDQCHGYTIESYEDQTGNQSLWRSAYVVTRGDTVLMILSQSSAIRGVCILIFEYFSFNMSSILFSLLCH